MPETDFAFESYTKICKEEIFAKFLTKPILTLTLIGPQRMIPQVYVQQSTVYPTKCIVGIDSTDR